MQRSEERSTAVTSGTVTFPHSSLRRFTPAAVICIGLLVIALGNVNFLVFNGVEAYVSWVGLVTIFFYGMLGGTVIICGRLLGGEHISADRYSRALAWIILSALALLALNVPIMLVLASEMSTNYLTGWILSAVSTGGTAGAVIGLIEARSIERAHLNQRLASEREAHKQHAEQLDYLNSVIRHEVLNNVAVIGGYTELLLEKQQGEAPEEMTVIYRQSREMANVITDIRVLIDTLHENYTLEERDLSQVLSDELEAVQTRTQAEVTVSASIPDNISVMADELVSRVFGNLLSNTVKHNENQSPEIEVTVEEAPDTVTVHIADNGSGISPGDREELFERRQRADHGIGLYLVARLVDRYEGSIELTETGPEGSVFSVTLNRAPAVSPQAGEENASSITPEGTGQVAFETFSD